MLEEYLVSISQKLVAYFVAYFVSMSKCEDQNKIRRIVLPHNIVIILLSLSVLVWLSVYPLLASLTLTVYIL